MDSNFVLAGLGDCRLVDVAGGVAIAVSRVRRGERWLVAVVGGKLVAQPVPDDAVVISRKDLPVGWG